MSRVMHRSQVKYLLFKYKQIYKFVVYITQQVNLFFRIVEYLIKTWSLKSDPLGLELKSSLHTTGTTLNKLLYF